MEPPPFAESAPPEKGFVTAADEEDEVCVATMAIEELCEQETTEIGFSPL